MTGRHAAANSGTLRRASRVGVAGQSSRSTGPGAPRSRMVARWRELTGSASTGTLAFGLLACACTLVAMAGPRASAELRTNAFRQLVAQTPALERTVIGSADDDTLSAGMPGLSDKQLSFAKTYVARHLAALPLAPAGTDWSGLTTPAFGVSDDAASVRTYGGTPKLELAYRDTLARYVRVVAGTLPAGKPGNGSTVTLQAVVTVATADRFDLGVGSRVPVLGTAITLQVTGIVRPEDPRSPFWGYDPLVTAPVYVQPMVGNPYWEGGVFVAGSAVAALQGLLNTDDIQLTWMFPLDLDRLTGAQAFSLNSTLAGTLQAAGQVTVNELHFPTQISLSTGATSLIDEFAIANSAVDNVLNLMLVSLAVVAAAVVLLAAWLLAEKRRDDYAVLRARGASRRQLALLALGGSAVVTLPATAAGMALAIVLTPAAASPLGWWLAGLTSGVALAGPALVTARTHREAGAEVRPDRPLNRVSSSRRLVIEAGLVLAAIGGLIVLREQGLGSGGGDLYPSAAPILVAIPAAIIVLRLYPLVVRALLRLTGRRPGATAFLGLARAARVPATAVLPAFAMILALALVSFAGMVRGALVRGEVAASWQDTGADAVITVPGSISAAAQRAIGAVPGVQRTAALTVTTALVGVDNAFVAVLVDPAQYSAFLAATPLPQAAEFAAAKAAAGPAGPVPVLASPAEAAQLGARPIELRVAGSQPVRAEVVGQAASMSAVNSIGGPSVRGYLVLPRSVFGASAPAPDVLLVAGAAINHALLIRTVSRELRYGSVLFRSGLLGGLERAPLQHGTYLALALGGDAAAVAGLLVLLLALMLSAPTREMTLARMTTMGLSAAQGRRLALIESLPQVVFVLIGAAASAAALAPLVGRALSLSVFTGSGTSVPVLIEPAWLAATAVALLALAVLTLAGQTVLASHKTPRFLRIGG